MATRYLDPVSGSDAADGTSFANRKKTLASAITGLTGGDTVRVIASTAITSLGQNATWTNDSSTVTLTSAVTANISDCESAWTASANVTATASTTTFRENTKSASLVIASGFTTGLVAYFATDTLNLSGYQQISLWIRTSTAQAAGVFQIKLCSDTAGATPVDTVDMPATAQNSWTPVNVDTAGALGSAIASVALYAVSDPGGMTVFLDNILACKAPSSADSLTLHSLISLNTDSDTPWHAIQSINGTSIKLGTGYYGVASAANINGAYEGHSGSPNLITTTTYKREPLLSTSSLTANVSGTSMDSPINIQGGWNRTDMSTQTDISWVRVSDSSLSICVSSSANYHYWNKIYACGGSAGVLASTADGVVVGEYGCAGTAYGLNSGTNCDYPIMTDGRYMTGVHEGISLTGTAQDGYDRHYKCKKIWGGGDNTTADGTGVTISATDMYGSMRFQIDEINNFDQGMGVDGPIQVHLYGTTFTNCNTYSISMNGSVFYTHNCSGIGTYQSGGRYYHTNFDQTATDHRIWWDDSGSSKIVTATDQRHTASDFSWKFSPQTAGLGTSAVGAINSYLPMWLSVAKIACPANEARTVKLWFRRTNTGLTMRLRVRGGQLPGIASDVTATMAAAADTWEELTVNFTPTSAGVVEVLAECWGGTTYNGWVDDLTVT